MITRASKAAVLAWLLVAGSAGADEIRMDEEKMAEEMKKYHFETVTTKEGLKFNIPSDMPIQKKDGLIQPVAFEEYLYVKFKLIEERVTGLEKKFDEMDKKLDSEFKELKELILKTQRLS